MRVSTRSFGFTAAVLLFAANSSQGQSINCLSSTPPAPGTVSADGVHVWETKNFPMVSSDGIVQNHFISVDSPQDPGFIADPAVFNPSQDTNYLICDNLQNGINNRTVPAAPMTATTVEELATYFPDRCHGVENSMDCPIRVIQLPAQTFVLSKNIKLCRNCILRGSGIDVTKIIAAGPMNMISMESGSRIENLTLEGAWNTEDSSYREPDPVTKKDRGGSGVLIDNKRNFALINVKIKNHSYQGLASWNARYGCLWNVNMERNGHRGINISRFSRHLKLFHTKGIDGHYAHVVLGHGSNNIEIKHTRLTNMYVTTDERNRTAVNDKGMLWLSNDVTNVKVEDLVIEQLREDPLVRPVGILLGGASHNTFRNVKLTNLGTAIQFWSSRVEQSVAGLRNRSIINNEFVDIDIKSDPTKFPTFYGIEARSARNFNVRSTECTHRHLRDDQGYLIPVTTNNRFYLLKISGYGTHVFYYPNSINQQSVPDSAVMIMDGSLTPVTRRVIYNQTTAVSSGW